MKEEGESLLDIDSMAGTRFEKAIEARLATNLLKSSCSIERLTERDPGGTPTNDPLLRGTRARGQEGPERQSKHFAWTVIHSKKQYLKSTGWEVQRRGVVSIAGWQEFAQM